MSVPEHQILLDTQAHLTPTPRVHYIQHTFTVPENAGKVGLTFTFAKEKLAQLFLSMYDPSGFRGNRMNPGAKGTVVLELWATPDDASEGALPGLLPAGEWRAQIDVEALGEETDYSLVAYADVYADGSAIPAPTLYDFPPNHVVRAEAGWYRGELHAHSTESDGKYAVATVIEAAIDTQLDFFALTDHFTVSQWRKLLPYIKQLALLRSVEVTSHQGHANLHGLNRWVDVFVDRPDWSMNGVADAVHAQGGLFCINHAFSGRLGWRAYDFDWGKADLMEVYHNLEAINNTYQVGLWDRLLTAGHRVIGIGGIDSHDPFTGLHKLGQLVTWVYADELSENGIIAGLNRGQVYLSKGPQMRFTAANNGHVAQMWETLHLPAGESVAFTVEVLTDQPLRLFVFRDGLFFDLLPVDAKPGEWQQMTFTDTPHTRAYYRVELHALHENKDHPYLPWRDHTTTQAICNPVWVAPVEEA